MRSQLANRGPLTQERDDRQAILRAADRLFYERGINAVGMDEIRDRSGVSLKRIYAHFPSKADLIQGYLHRRDTGSRDAIEHYVTSRWDDPADQLLGVFDALHAWTSHQPGFRGCAFHNVLGELGGTTPDTVSVVQANKHHLRAFLVRTARRAGLHRPTQLAFALLLLAEGALVTAAVDADPEIPRRAKAAAAVLIDAAR